MVVDPQTHVAEVIEEMAGAATPPCAVACTVGVELHLNIVLFQEKVHAEEVIEATASAKIPVYAAVSGVGAEGHLSIAMEGGA